MLVSHRRMVMLETLLLLLGLKAKPEMRTPIIVR